MDTFEEAYARYLKFLALLDGIEDISEKNLLFRELKELLSALEQGLSRSEAAARLEELADDEWEHLLEPDLHSPTRLVPAVSRPAVTVAPLTPSRPEA